jgi:hypothetical protein
VNSYTKKGAVDVGKGVVIDKKVSKNVRKSKYRE